MKGNSSRDRDGRQQQDSVHPIKGAKARLGRRKATAGLANTDKKAIAEHGDGLKPQARVATLRSRPYTIFNTFSPHYESKQSAFDNIDGWKKYRKPPKLSKMAR